MNNKWLKGVLLHQLNAIKAIVETTIRIVESWEAE